MRALLDANILYRTEMVEPGGIEPPTSTMPL